MEVKQCARPMQARSVPVPLEVQDTVPCELSPVVEEYQKDPPVEVACDQSTPQRLQRKNDLPTDPAIEGSEKMSSSLRPVIHVPSEEELVTEVKEAASIAAPEIEEKDVEIPPSQPRDLFFSEVSVERTEQFAERDRMMGKCEKGVDGEAENEEEEEEAEKVKPVKKTIQKGKKRAPKKSAEEKAKAKALAKEAKALKKAAAKQAAADKKAKAKEAAKKAKAAEKDKIKEAVKKAKADEKAKAKKAIEKAQAKSDEKAKSEAASEAKANEEAKAKEPRPKAKAHAKKGKADTKAKDDANKGNTQEPMEIDSEDAAKGIQMEEKADLTSHGTKAKVSKKTRKAEDPMKKNDEADQEAKEVASEAPADCKEPKATQPNPKKRAKTGTKKSEPNEGGSSMPEPEVPQGNGQAIKKTFAGRNRPVQEMAAMRFDAVRDVFTCSIKDHVLGPSTMEASLFKWVVFLSN